jgi:hypothetical protein
LADLKVGVRGKTVAEVERGWNDARGEMCWALEE